MRPFNKNECDWRHMAAVTADCNCADDCDMKCPYENRKSACYGCEYYGTCGDPLRTEKCNGKKDIA